MSYYKALDKTFGKPSPATIFTDGKSIFLSRGDDGAVVELNAGSRAIIGTNSGLLSTMVDFVIPDEIMVSMKHIDAVRLVNEAHFHQYEVSHPTMMFKRATFFAYDPEPGEVGAVA